MVKAHYLVAAAGIALAVAAAAGGASLALDRGGSSTVVARPAPAVTAAAPAIQKDFVYYLVGSEAERRVIINQEALAAEVRYADGIEAAEHGIAVLGASTPAERASALEMIYEGLLTMSEAGTKVSFVDTTAP